VLQHRRQGVRSAMYAALVALKSGTDDESLGRHIIPGQVVEACKGIMSPRLLDVGAGRGEDLFAVEHALRDAGHSSQLAAIESFPLSVDILRSKGVNVASVNIEYDRFPFDNQSMDVVICNQVLEHTKEIFWVVAEIARVLQLGGALLLGVPNLGSLHNRLALLAGYQPPAIPVFSSHVRGFTIPDLTKFLELGGIFKVISVKGGNFYPLPVTLSRPLSRLLPSLSVSSFYVAQKTGRGNFLDIFTDPRAMYLVDTPYFRG
jgi:SAM-dependent methyltransferase